MFLIAYLEDEFGDVATYFSTKPDLPHQWGMQYLLDVWPSGEEFFWHCKKVGFYGKPLYSQLRTSTYANGGEGYTANSC